MMSAGTESASISVSASSTSVDVSERTRTDTDTDTHTHTNGHATHPIHYTTTTNTTTTSRPSSSVNVAYSQAAATQLSASLPISFYPGGHRSLPGISLRSFLLGITLGLSINLSFTLAYFNCYLWRIPCFVAVLCIFHYLEFDMTARYNTVDAKVASFLLFNNGAAYEVANAAAVAECIIRWGLHRLNVSRGLPIFLTMPAMWPTVPSWLSIILAVMVVAFGQTVRSLAMKQAGRSFNHMVQSTKRLDHVLVTDRLYAWSRHPSYLGFFWWGLGTQILLGNWVCFMAYAVVLWKFFADRIANEERHLITFFGQEYLSYRDRVPVLIPFIR